jgi:hypothetical protein
LLPTLQPPRSADPVPEIGPAIRRIWLLLIGAPVALGTLMTLAQNPDGPKVKKVNRIRRDEERPRKWRDGLLVWYDESEVIRFSNTV